MHIVKSSLLAVGLLAALALSACTNNGGTVNVPGDAVDAGDMASGDMEITGFDLPWDEESVQGECETNQDCDGKFAEMDVCQIALCDSVQKVCVLGSKKDYTPCDDGNACVLDTYCLDGVCGNGFDLLCTDSNPCTDDSCDPVSGCAFENNAAACDDGNQCTTDDTCSGGQCVGNPGGCPCTTDEECQPLVQNLCSYDEMACEEGFCVVSQSLEVVCDDSMDSDCQLNLCDPETGACEMTFIVGPCSDGSTCTVGDTCQDGVCVPGQSMCECATDADCAEFDDANLCNGVLVCAEAQCVVQAGSVVTCSQEGLGFCQMSKCNPATGNCETLSKANGITCDDGDDCTDADACLNGACVGQALACDDGDPCTADVCGEDRGCEHLPLSDVPCDDGDECTDGDMCFEGLCQPGQFTCGECGDGLCEGPETCALCPEDCGECGSDCCEAPAAKTRPSRPASATSTPTAARPSGTTSASKRRSRSAASSAK